MLAHTRLLVPKTLPIKREAASSAASVVMPETKTVKYKYLFIDVIIPVGIIIFCLTKELHAAKIQPAL